MEDLVSMCERRCRKACNLRSAAEDSDEACHSGSSGGRARRYRKRGSPKSAARDAGAMDTDPSPVRLWESEGHSEGYPWRGIAYHGGSHFLRVVLYAWYVLRYAHAHVIYLRVAEEMGNHT